jgi:hypothetical protein
VTFSCNLEEFKQGVAEFTKAAPACDAESLENGFKAVGLLYLGMTEEHPADRAIAVSYINYASRRYMDRDFELARVTGEQT